MTDQTSCFCPWQAQIVVISVWQSYREDFLRDGDKTTRGLAHKLVDIFENAGQERLQKWRFQNTILDSESGVHVLENTEQSFSNIVQLISRGCSYCFCFTLWEADMLSTFLI